MRCLLHSAGGEGGQQRRTQSNIGSHCNLQRPLCPSKCLALITCVVVAVLWGPCGPSACGWSPITCQLVEGFVVRSTVFVAVLKRQLLARPGFGLMTVNSGNAADSSIALQNFQKPAGVFLHWFITPTGSNNELQEARSTVQILFTKKTSVSQEGPARNKAAHDQ